MTIPTEAITVDREQAQVLYEEYKAHRHYADPIDREIQRTYRLIAQGRVVIRALASVTAAGLQPDTGLPKLALMRADKSACTCELLGDGSATFDHPGQWRSRSACRIRFPAGSFPDAKARRRGQAVMPLIPVHLRPRQAIDQYHVLWEANWHDLPVDPVLLRRIGKADLWLVVAAWDLTPVELAALSTRVSG